MDCEDCGAKKETHSLELRVMNLKTSVIVASRIIWLCSACVEKDYCQMTGDDISVEEAP